MSEQVALSDPERGGFGPAGCLPPVARGGHKIGPCVRGHEKVPTGGQVLCPRWRPGSPRWWPVGSPPFLARRAGPELVALRGDGGGVQPVTNTAQGAPLKNARERMDVLNAYRQVGTYRGAADVCGMTHKTVKRLVEANRAVAAGLTTNWIKRGTHRSVRDLVRSIRTSDHQLERGSTTQVARASVSAGRRCRAAWWLRSRYRPDPGSVRALRLNRWPAQLRSACGCIGR